MSIASVIPQEGEGLAPYKWAATTLTYKISEDFTPAERAVIIQAGTEWGKVANITWVYSDDPVIWARPGETPETYLPNDTENGGDIFLPNPEVTRYTDLFNAAHEIGHALGLIHTAEFSVMNPQLAYFSNFGPHELTPYDVEHVQEMYPISVVGVHDF